MPTISTHVLNSVDGSHAAGVKVECLGCASSGSCTVLFSGLTDEGGRLTANISLAEASFDSIALEFHSGDYFAARGLGADALVRSVQFRIQLQPGDERHHLPVIAAPHGCSAWWSP